MYHINGLESKYIGYVELWKTHCYFDNFLDVNI